MTTKDHQETDAADNMAARLQILQDISDALRSGEFLTRRSCHQPGEATCPTI